MHLERNQILKLCHLALLSKGPRLYLVCRYRDYENERSLALPDHSAKASTLTFERPKDFDLQKYDDDGRFGFGEANVFVFHSVLTRAQASTYWNLRYRLIQRVVEIDDQYEITATVVDTAQLKWWLRVW